MKLTASRWIRWTWIPFIQHFWALLFTHDIHTTKIDYREAHFKACQTFSEQIIPYRLHFFLLFFEFSKKKNKNKKRRKRPSWTSINSRINMLCSALCIVSFFNCSILYATFHNNTTFSHDCFCYYLHIVFLYAQFCLFGSMHVVCLYVGTKRKSNHLNSVTLLRLKKVQHISVSQLLG